MIYYFILISYDVLFSLRISSYINLKLVYIWHKSNSFYILLTPCLKLLFIFNPTKFLMKSLTLSTRNNLSMKSPLSFSLAHFNVYSFWTNIFCIWLTIKKNSDRGLINILPIRLKVPIKPPTSLNSSIKLYT